MAVIGPNTPGETGGRVRGILSFPSLALNTEKTRHQPT